MYLCPKIEKLRERKVRLLLTYADNFAVGFFKKQGFEETSENPSQAWFGFIKPYEGGTLMESKIDPEITYSNFRDVLRKQKEDIFKKIRENFDNRDPFPVKKLKNLSKLNSEETQLSTNSNIKLELIPGVLENSWCQ